MKRYVIFDFAFTLIKFRFVTREGDLSPTAKIIETYLKSGIPKEVLEKFESLDMFSVMSDVYDWMLGSLPKEKADENQRRASKTLEALEMVAVENTELLPDCEASLKRIREKGLKMGIVSNNSERYILTILKNFSLSSFFDVIIGRSSPGRLKPHPDHLTLCLNMLKCNPYDAVYVGDEPKDMACAKEAGVYAIGVLTGWNKSGLIKSASANMLISNLSELPSVLETLD